MTKKLPATTFITIILVILCAVGCTKKEVIYNSILLAGTSVLAIITLKDPATGEYYFVQGDQVQKGNTHVDNILQSELESGRKVNADLDVVGYNRLSDILENIKSVSHIRDHNNWGIVLLKRDYPYAFNIGTNVVIHQPILKLFKKDDELAAIVGHELAHAVLSHNRKREQNHSSGDGVLGFNHQQEMEADKLSIFYCALAGYNPFAMSDVLYRLMGSEPNEQTSVSYPDILHRIENSQLAANQDFNNYSKGEKNANFEKILSRKSTWFTKAPPLKSDLSNYTAIEEFVITTVLNEITIIADHFYGHKTNVHQPGYKDSWTHIPLNYNSGKMSRIQFLSHEQLGKHEWRVYLKNQTEHDLLTTALKVVIHSKNENIPTPLIRIPHGSVESGIRFWVDFYDPRVNFDIDNLKEKDIEYKFWTKIRVNDSLDPKGLSQPPIVSPFQYYKHAN